MSKQQTLFKDEPKFDSKEELMFHYYLKELKEQGFIKEIEYQPAPYKLFEGLHMPCFVKSKSIEVEVMKEKEYTADWKITWTDKAKGALIWTSGDRLLHRPTLRPKDHPERFIPFYHDDMVSVLDIKGGAGAKFARANSSAITFSTNQKWVYEKFGVYVQKVVVTLDKHGIFSKTFTPRQVFINEVYVTSRKAKKGKPGWEKGDSKLKYTPMLIEEYMRRKNV